MDISGFFPVENATQEELQIDEYKLAIFKLVNRNYITTSQYAYFLDFIKVMGTISSADWFLEQISSITTPVNNKTINVINPLITTSQLQSNDDIHVQSLSESDKSLSDKSSDDTGTGTGTIPIESIKPIEQIEPIDPIITEFKITVSKTFSKMFKYKNNELNMNRNVKYYLTRLETIDLTVEQKKAMQTLYDFLVDYHQNTFGLYGYAGSGKTTTVVEFVSYMASNKYLNSIAFAAPTNKAVNVIKSKFKSHLKKIIESVYEKKLDDTFNFDDELEFLEQKGLVIKFMTIHKLLMFQTDYSVSGETIFVRDAKQGSLISHFELVIVDECSMINMDMVDNIFEEIRSIGKPSTKTSNNKGYRPIPKIIFTGDPAQLPPVNEEDSSIFCKNSKQLMFKDYMDAMSFKYSDTIVSDAKSIMKHRYTLLLNDLGKMKTTLMKNVVRSKLDAVTSVCHELRKWIRSEELPALELFRGQKGIDFFPNDPHSNKTKTEWFQKFLNSVKNNGTCIIVTWTNRQTDIYNDTIRRHIFRGREIKKFEEHDVLMLSEFYGLDLGEEFLKQRLYTSEQIKVVTAKLTDTPIRMFDPIVNAGLKKIKQGIKLENRLKTLIDGLNELYCKNVKFNCWVLKVHKFGEESSHCMTLIVIDDSDLERYEKFKNETSAAIKNFSRQLLNQYRTAPKQIERCIVKPLWKQWNKIFVESFACVNYGYSITCHKAQGSSFYDVYVDLHDILLNTQRPVEAKKCAYTAATRTSNELNILI
jgi:uncharacterized protein (UPF0297 family)